MKPWPSLLLRPIVQAGIGYNLIKQVLSRSDKEVFNIQSVPTDQQLLLLKVVVSSLVYS